MNPLGKKAREAIFWTTGFSLFRDLLQLGQTLVLVRLLAPEAYGQFGLVTTVVGFYTVLSFREFLNHTLQVRSDDDVHYQDHFTAGAAMQVVVCLAMNATALFLRTTSTYAPVAPLLHVMSLLFLLDLPSEFRVKMLERKMEWRRLRLLNALGIVFYAVASIALALAGVGAYALLVPTLLVPLPYVYDLFVNARWRPTWHWSRQRYMPSLRFGLTRVGSAALSTGSQLIEGATLVRLIGFVSFGFFGRAVGLAQLCCVKIASVLVMSLYPVLTRIPRGSESYRRLSALMLRTVAWVVIPGAVVVAVLARTVVGVLYGSKWLAVVPIVPAALAMGVMLALLHTSYFLLLAHQQQRRCLVIDTLRVAGTVTALLLLVRYGVAMYLVGLSALYGVAFLLVARWLYHDDAITVGGVAAAIVPPLAASAVALALPEFVRRTTGVPVDRIWAAAAYAACYGLAYIVVLRALFAPLLAELVGYLPHGDRLQSVLALRAAPSAPQIAV